MITRTQKESLDHQNKGLLQQARKLLDKHPLYAEKDAEKFGRSALRNVLDIAQAATCLEEVAAFVEYQLGRDFKKWNAKGFGTALVVALGSGGPVAKAADDNQVKALNIDGDACRVELAGRYLGYLYRYFVFKASEQDEQKKNQQRGR